MPIEIKELVIRAVVDGKSTRPSRPGPAPQADGPGDARDAIVEEAVKEVLRALRASKER